MAKKKLRFQKVVKYEKAKWNNWSAIFLVCLAFPIATAITLMIMVFLPGEVDNGIRIRICILIGLGAVLYPIITFFIRKRTVTLEEI